MTEPTTTFVAEFYGGPFNKQVTELRELSLVYHADELDLADVLDDSDPMMPMPGRIVSYGLVRSAGNVPERDGGGRYIYQFKGYHRV